MINPLVQQNPADWQHGYEAAITGQPVYPSPADVRDSLAFASGWIEGRADCKLAKQYSRLPAEQKKVIDDLMRE